MNLKNTLRLACLIFGMTSLLASCAPAQPSKPQRVGASVHALNYGGKEVVLIVKDPKDKNNSGGGDALNPYGMGGTICCFGIPATWHPGLQVIVKYSFYPDETWHEQLVDVPPYPEGIAGNIWLAMHEDGKAEAVVSHFGPTRPEWPGRIKGPPVASKEYAQKVSNDQLANKKGMLNVMEKGLVDGRERTKEQIDRMKSAIEYTKEQIRQMEAEQP